MKALCILLFCIGLTAQSDLVTRLIAAPDEAAATQMLAGDVATAELFEACRKAAQAHIDRREHAEALRGFRIALAVAKAQHSDHLAAIALRGAGIAEFRMDHASAALATYEEGLAAAQRAGDRSMQGELYRGIGVTRRNMGNFTQAIHADEQSVAAFRDVHDQHQIAASLNNLAANYRNMGDLRRAAEIWEDTRREGAGFADTVTSARLNLALIAGELGNTEVAIAYLEQSAAESEKAKDWHTLAVELANLGSSYRTVHEYGKSLAVYNRALELMKQLKDHRLESAVYVNRSALYEATNRRALAIGDLEESLNVHEGGESKDAQSQALANLAWLELASGQPDKALAHAQQAVETIDEFHAPELQWQPYDSLGRALSFKKDSVKARAAFEHAIQSIETLRSQSGGSEQDGQNFLAGRIAPYHDLLQLDLAENLPEQALAMAERARARQLLDVVRSGKTEPAASMTAEELAAERRLSANLAQLDQQLMAADAKTRPAVQNRLDLATREMEAFRVQLYTVHPMLAAQKGDAAPITLAQTAELLPDAHTVLVEFTSTEEYLDIFTIVRGPAMKTHTLRWPREELAHEVDDYVNKLGSRDLGYRDAGQKLYTKLLAPLDAELRGATMLVILPDGPLWNLPFQALIAPDGKYLIEHQAMFYAPSLTYLRESRRADASRHSAHKLLALGDPEDAGLPEAEREVRELAGLYGVANSKTLAGPEALKATWERDAPNYQILHIATHGILNARNPMYSYLMFSGKDKVLEAREVVNLKLQSELVVLSACETGRGRVSIGEGLVGMSWAFLLAGARTTVVSQWKTDSSSTTELMIGMHEALRPALANRARSLQKAALAVMRNPEYRHPFYWAGFVMVGDGY